MERTGHSGVREDVKIDRTLEDLQALDLNVRQIVWTAMHFDATVELEYCKVASITCRASMPQSILVSPHTASSAHGAGTNHVAHQHIHQHDEGWFRFRFAAQLWVHAPKPDYSAYLTFCIWA